MRQQFVILGLLVSVAVSGCSGTDEAPVAAPSQAVTPTSSPSPTPSPSPSTAPSPSPSPSPTPPPQSGPTDAELATLAVNELGRVLVGEWHLIGDTDGEYRTSRDTFRAQLEELYDRGYRPVTQAEFIAGTFPIPLGTSPILLTFDDSTRSQFDLDQDGALVEGTAVAIIEEFAAAHDDWRATAVFGFNFPEPFGDSRFAEKLTWLVDNGYELSNHTVGHANLGSLSGAEATANLAENQARLQAVVPDVPVPSLTLPFGAHAVDPAVERTGTAQGTTYLHELVYLVGAYPSRSPHDVEFDPMKVQRVPAHAVVGTGPEWWGDRLDDLDEPGVRFVSDGDPSVVTYPADLADQASPVDGAGEVRTYQP